MAANLPVQSETTLVDWNLRDEDKMMQILVLNQVRMLIAKNWVCPVTGKVLDVREMFAVADEDGDILAVAHKDCDTEENRQKIRKASSGRYVVKGLV